MVNATSESEIWTLPKPVTYRRSALSMFWAHYEIGRPVSGKNGRLIADGPFVESKQAISGYFLLQVNDLDEAVAIAQGCPGLPYGAKIKVRPVAGECPLAAEARVESDLAEVTALLPNNDHRAMLPRHPVFKN
jgi:hypothetical protein